MGGGHADRPGESFRFGVSPGAVSGPMLPEPTA